MSDFELDREPELAPEEEQALAAVLAAPALSGDDWESLRGRVTDACELPLARRRRAAHPRRAQALKWLRPALPLAAAALLLILLWSPLDGPRSGDNGQSADLTAAERALLADVSDAEFAQLVSGAADAEALLLIAVEK